MIDLHMHSCYSEDGEFKPEELASQCANRQMSIMSVTDHNCARANDKARSAARTEGIIYIPGIEIDCIYQEVNFHVLGYGIDYNSRDFACIESDLKQQSLLASLEKLAKTQAMGFHVTENDMWAMSKDCYWQEMWTGDR